MSLILGVFTLIGGLIGFIISEAKEWRLRSKRKQALWEAINAEVVCCHSRADGFLKEEYKAPLYRLPTIAYLNCLPLLLADGALNGEESKTLTEFFAEVETLNRGLDLATEARGNVKNLNAEDGRNRLKAKRICSTGSLYQKTSEILHSKL